jgi:DNA (cytosine-5)-methyltransferase 1
VGRRNPAAADDDHKPEFIGSRVAADEARNNWPKRYGRNTVCHAMYLQVVI